MLEGIIIAAIAGSILSYLANHAIKAVFDRPMTHKQREKMRRKIDQDHKIWLNSPEFQKLNQERLSRLQP
jgi:hypothetical protein